MLVPNRLVASNCRRRVRLAVTTEGWTTVARVALKAEAAASAEEAICADCCAVSRNHSR